MMADFKESPSQTAGPYVHIGCVPTFAGLQGMYGGNDLGAKMITGDPNGSRITLTCHVIDGDGVPLKDAMVEIWQAGPDGTYGPTEGFSHWGRQPTDAHSGELVFETLKPGATAGQAPHLLAWITARGINLGLTTRIYFADEDNSSDPVLAVAGDRQATLIAQGGDGSYRHDIYLQGAQETVFFDV
ncbi:Intradiol ring-cleavage dioxygenase [Sulfitobacter noctilucae]|uniref:protocatechuate 3,4-dioxygenase subunit alpha n=1 Tax=Sulfitobacter noctilucae TaxID=1342302 RepID=UPI000469036E|nr:protocatechuate 3,4-dioxygenase subunit alpha [Sulfitobacter noctilucae]KIN60546.1 Intradiol ring-cleavage dioxygenase [Sulfitobacter noctilucae]